MTRWRYDPRSDFIAAVKAGVVYCVLVFGIGFCLGIVRVLVVAPHLGETVAVALEAPVMLASSWAVSLWCVRRVHLRAAVAPRLLMGVIALAVLLFLEAGLSAIVFGRPIAAWFAQYRTVPGAIGLGAQCAFGLVPVLQAWWRPG